MFELDEYFLVGYKDDTLCCFMSTKLLIGMKSAVRHPMQTLAVALLNTDNCWSSSERLTGIPKKTKLLQLIPSSWYYVWQTPKWRCNYYV